MTSVVVSVPPLVVTSAAAGLPCTDRTKFKEFRHGSAWIPAFAGMTSVVVSVPPLVVTPATAGVQGATGRQDVDFRFPTDQVTRVANTLVLMCSPGGKPSRHPVHRGWGWRSHTRWGRKATDTQEKARARRRRSKLLAILRRAGGRAGGQSA